MAQLFTVLDEAGLRPDITNNVRRAIWYKLWGNMTMNPLSALTLAPADRLLADQQIKPFILDCMAEAALIGADVATAPPAVIKAMANHILTDKGLEAFMKDVAATGQKIL